MLTRHTFTVCTSSCVYIHTCWATSRVTLIFKFVPVFHFSEPTFPRFPRVLFLALALNCLWSKQFSQTQWLCP